MTLGSALTFLGQVDGAVAAIALGVGSYAPAEQHAALVVAGVAGGLGVLLNLIAKWAGLSPVAPTQGAPPAS